MLRLLIALVAAASFTAATADATPRTTAAIAAYKKLQRDQRLLNKRIDRLSTGEKIEVKSYIEGSSSVNDPGADPDNDGLDNEAEEALGTSSCNADTDNDGTDDGHDNFEDGGDGAYAKGTVVSVVSRVVTVGSTAFTIDDNTEFRGRGFSEGDLVPGVCVEIEGHVSGWTNIADQIKQQRASECSGDGED